MDYRLDVKTPLGDDLLIRRMSGHEKLGRMFEYIVDFISEKADLDSDSLLGQSVTVDLATEKNGASRYFNGLVCSFNKTGEENDGFFTYQAILKPWLWVLTRRANCRIFQEKSIPDIIKEIFGDHGFSDFDLKLSGSYSQWDYCVQYRETDFNFVSRLMEQAGIYYYFTHSSSKHTLVLGDSYSAHAKVSGNAKIVYRATLDHTYEADYIYRWSTGKQIQTGSYVMDDYDFTAPTQNLEVRSANPGSSSYTDKEVYDYPGEYLTSSRGEMYVKARLQEMQCQIEKFRGTGNARQLAVGGLFQLADYYRSDQNKEYLVIAASYEMEGEDRRSGSQGSMQNPYVCNFETIDSKIQYRSDRITPKPLISGPQTATVVGKSGEEIWTDKYGRVKVQFRWDREGEDNESSSCWIRVTQPWAGKRWGNIAIPRINDEVVVNFLEGDPDQPIITGSVYNASQMPPYTLPENQTQSGLKSRSSKNGTEQNFNELRFEDKKGEEQVYLNAEKDFEQVTENNHSLKIGFDKGDANKDKGNMTLDIYNDRTTTIDQGNDSLEIKKGDQATTISKGDQTTTVSMGNHTLSVAKGKSSIEAMQSIELKVGSNSIKIDQSGITIKGVMVTLEGTAKLEAKSPMSTVEGSGMLTIKGGVVMIN